MSFIQLQWGAGTGGDEATYDVVLILGDGANSLDNRPQSSGVYSDTLTFTVMDDD